MRLTNANTIQSLQNALSGELDRLAGKYTAGSITASDFLQGGMQKLSLAHSRAAVLGAGKAGKKPAPFSALLGVPARATASQEAFLHGFLRDLAAGRYKPKPQGGEGAGARKSRFDLYGMRLVGTANAAWLETIKGGQVEVYWSFGPAKEHCQTCIAENAIGWRDPMTLTRVPGDGTTKCLTRCRCHLQTRDGRKSFSVNH